MSTTEVKIKPAVFKQGVPAEGLNGFYNLEAELIAHPGQQIVAIVTYGVQDIVTKEIAGEQYPIIEYLHIEPLRTKEAIEQAKEMQEAARELRLGANQLDIPKPKEPMFDLDKPLVGDEVAEKRDGKK
jgi:hypothetical protein